MLSYRLTTGSRCTPGPRPAAGSPTLRERNARRCSLQEGSRNLNFLMQMFS